MTDNAEFDQLFEQAHAKLRGVRQGLEAGGAIELSDLEGLVRQIATKIAALPRGQGRTFRNALLALYDDIDRLGGELVRRRDQAESQLKSLRTSGQVAAAYATKPRGR